MLWNNAAVNNSKHHSTSMNLGLNSFWSEDANTATAVGCLNVTPQQTTLISNNLPATAQMQQEQLKPQKLDDTEFDITEIVDKMWPSGDDSGIKLD